MQSTHCELQSTLTYFCPRLAKNKSATVEPAVRAWKHREAARDGGRPVSPQLLLRVLGFSGGKDRAPAPPSPSAVGGPLLLRQNRRPGQTPRDSEELRGPGRAP
jgi:hypothetical protein